MLDQKSRVSTSLVWGVRPGRKSASQKTFVCFGVPRGGTSAIGGVMRKLGIFMGHEVPNNHEDKDMVGRPNPRRLETIKQRDAEHDVWGWKDPNAANYLPFLAPRLRNPHYVVVTRDVVATTKGHMRWHSRQAKSAVADVAVQQQRNVMFSLYCDAPVMMVSYEKAILHPKSLLAEMVEFIGFDYPQDDEWVVEFLAPGVYKDV